MSAVTLATYRDRVRQRADMEHSTFISDAELNGYINSSIAELYDILVQKFGNDYYYNELSFSLVAGTDAYDLPADFFKVLGVDLLIAGNQYATIKPFMYSERNFYANVVVRSSLGIQPMRYRIRGSKIVIRPIPMGTQTIRLCYVPLPLELTTDASTFDGINGWEEYVVADAAMKCLMKEESDITQVLQMKMALLQRIESAAENRDIGSAQRVSDVRTSYFDDFYGQSF